MTFGAIILAAYAVFHWFDTFHLGVGLVTLGACAAVVRRTRPQIGRLVLRRPSTLGKHNPIERPATDPWHESTVGLATGAAAIAALLAAYFVAERIPGLHAAIADRDRAQVEIRLDALETAESW